MPCSQLAWWGLGMGVEHLDATIRLLDQQVAAGGPILTSANYTVQRGALVGSCQAVALLAPKTRAERTTVALQIAREEYRQVFNFRERVVTHPGLVKEARQAAEGKDWLARPRDRKNEIEAMLRERGANPRLTDTAMIERAAELVHASGEDADLLRSSVAIEWALGSGAAHGRLLMTLHRPEGHLSEAGTALLGASYDQVASQITGVSLILNEDGACGTNVGAAPSLNRVDRRGRPGNPNPGILRTPPVALVLHGTGSGLDHS
jgi:hypothetical protein